jgi:type IX secretion system PorP/SprF family membrane protein
MKIKTKILLAILIGISSIASAQQEPFLTTSWANLSLSNASFTGQEFNHKATLINKLKHYRKNNYINVNMANYEYKFDKINSGIGISYINDQIGVYKNNSLRFNYAYHFDLKNDNTLSFGANLTYLNRKVEINTSYPNDPVIALSTIHYPLIYLNTGLGVSYKSEKLKLGLSVSNYNLYRNNEHLYYAQNLHYYGFAEYAIEVNDKLDINPFTMVLFENSYYLQDVGARVTYNDLLWIAPSLRIQDRFSISAGVDLLDKFRIGYAYDMNSGTQLHGIYSHEVVLGFQI